MASKLACEKDEGKLSSTMIAILKGIKAIISAACRRSPFPASRNLLNDFVYEGRRKNLIYEIFGADITDFLAWKNSRTGREKGDYSITSFVAHVFAKTIDDHPDIQAYRGGLWGQEWIVFDDVDIALIVEKTIEGSAMPWIHTIRACNRQSMASFSRAIQRAKNEQIESTLRWRIGRAIMHLPTLIRRLAWLLPRHNPFFMKFLVGTVAVTSVGMFSRGNLALLPATPLTLTLAIGSIESRAMFQEGEWVQREYITLSLCADHAIVDGAPLARFIETMRGKLRTPELFTEPEDAQ